MKEDLYRVALVFKYNAVLPVIMTDQMLQRFVTSYSRPTWVKVLFNIRFFHFWSDENQYIKINMLDLMALQANLVGYKDEHGVNHITERN